MILYACTSSYPTKARDACLLEIARLRAQYGSAIKAVGFSGHHLGLALDAAALALGATHFERHFTMNKSWKGTDQRLSLEPDELLQLRMDLDSVQSAMREKHGQVLDCERSARIKMKYQPNPAEGQ